MPWGGGRSGRTKYACFKIAFMRFKNKHEEGGVGGRCLPTAMFGLKLPSYDLKTKHQQHIQ